MDVEEDDAAAASLDERLAAAGMYTVGQMLGVTPMTRWATHAGMDSLATFEAWVDRRAAEFLRMKARYELGDKDKDDDLYEWALAHGAAFSEVRTNLKAALAGDGPRTGRAWVVTNGRSGQDLRYRMWFGGVWVWTKSATDATQFARERDATLMLPEDDGNVHAVAEVVRDTL